MKKFTTLLIFIHLLSFTNAQIIIENPKIGIRNSEVINITKIEINDNSTILTFFLNYSPGLRVGIPDKSYIMVVGQPDTLFMTHKEAPAPDSTGGYSIPPEGLAYKLYFPAINPNAKYLDFSEANPYGYAWLIYNIEINKPSYKITIPDDLLGNWFSKENGECSYCLYDTIAIVDEKIWKYESIRKDGKIYEIGLKRNNESKLLQISPESDDTQLICEKGELFKAYSNDPEFYFKILNQKENNRLFKQENVVYKGIIRNYRPETGTFISIFYRDKVTNEEFPKVEDINSDGTFSFEILLDKPQEMTVNIPAVGTVAILLTPGKNLFHILNSGTENRGSIFLGESAAPSLRRSQIKHLSSNLRFQNQISALSEDEYLDFIFTADKNKIYSFTEPILKNIKSENNLFYVPRRSIKMGTATVSSIGFWISNEITNKQYREFANDVISHPDKIIKWISHERDSINGSIETKTNVELYSEVAKDLIDSTKEVKVYYDSKLMTLNVLDYLNKKEFNDYPVYGVPFKGAEYFCYWLNQKYNLLESDAYRIPSEIQYRIVADYIDELKNYKNAPDNDGLNIVPEDTLAYLNSNAAEWFNRISIGKRIDPELINAILVDWDYGDSITVEYNNKVFTTAGFRLVKRESNSAAKQLNKSQLKLIILVLGIVLTIFSLGFLLWKWRVRQRFKKEQQFRKMKELELTAIRSQMNPHFLFNCLNSVQNLIQQNKGHEAHLYLADFAGLIRKVLQNSEKEEVSLEEELEMTKQYLTLEKLRFDFDFTISVDNDIDANNTMIPSLLLQPFAENAIIHGLQNKTEDRRLNIVVDRISDGIRIIIEDNGVGRKAAKQIATEKNGKGSKLMKERLEILQQKHGEKYQIEIIDIEGNETGTKVEIIIPEEK